MRHVQSRSYKDPHDSRAQDLLNELLLNEISPKDYQQAMLKIGHYLGASLKRTLNADKKYCVVVTAEDADYLAKGILEELQGSVSRTFLACFWNRRSVVNDVSVAPIFNSFLETGFEEADELIVVKSIIAGSCVVKTNITALFDRVLPSAVHIVAPIMHSQSENKLKSQFPLRIAEMFNFTFLAKDNKKAENGEIEPGIGGNVYKKLGFQDQDDKNTFFPEIIKEKMLAHA